MLAKQVIEEVAKSLGFADAENLGVTGGTYALGGRTTVFQSNLLWVLYLALAPAPEAVSLHVSTPIRYLMRVDLVIGEHHGPSWSPVY
jgi:hypothetical protein